MTLTPIAGTAPPLSRAGSLPAPGASAADAGFTTGFGEDINLDDLLGGLFGRATGLGTCPRCRPGGGHRAHRRRPTTAPVGRSPWRPGQTRTLEVTIPAGVTSGQRIRLAGQGGQGTEGATAGDLYLIVRISPHRRYRVDGRDLHVELPLAPWEAALGTTAAVDTPDGEAKVKVPPGTSSGRRLRLRGRGLPNPRGTPGDLFAEARILVPRKLSADERRLFEELAATSTFDPRRRQ
jgi:curved DNA-binding protein